MQYRIGIRAIRATVSKKDELQDPDNNKTITLFS